MAMITMHVNVHLVIKSDLNLSEIAVFIMSFVQTVYEVLWKHETCLMSLKSQYSYLMMENGMTSAVTVFCRC